GARAGLHTPPRGALWRDAGGSRGARGARQLPSPAGAPGAARTMTDAAEFPQALILRTAAGPTIVARSPDLPFALEEFALGTTVAYGTTADDAGFEATFAWPAGTETIAVVSVLSPTDRGAGYELALRFIFVDRDRYERIGEPFAITDHFPVNLQLRGSV